MTQHVRDHGSPAWARELERQRERRLSRDRAAHRAEERARYWRDGHARIRHPRPPATPPGPTVPSSPAGHPLYDAARQLLKGWERAELGSDMDSTARDLLQEYALAAIAGTDPAAAVLAFRRRAAHDRAALVYGTAIADGLER